jgi:hypothetical protein
VGSLLLALLFFAAWAQAQSIVAQGAQRLAVPNGTRLSDYRTLLIQSMRFSRPWAGAGLNLK